MATSAVPAAIDALLSILTEASKRAGSALANTQIFDGPALTNLEFGRRLFVGWQPEADNAAALTQDFAYAGARRRDEEFQISCYAEVESGDTDMQPLRTAAFALVAVVETELRASDDAPTAPTLNGTVLWAHLTTGNLQQGQTLAGAAAGVAFTISCRSRL
ncbi:hypothetical protein [Streptomyces sp. NBC_01262]|uniref:hypothetical protein n=1 Tax=Streptomyces sp. NBC_01262 TaxID=2903803 RepID=UPI002E381E50|nr:hypothetical protein [Streptomyces sp. NBC_01262]